jgi:hypothetical protein
MSGKTQEREEWRREGKAGKGTLLRKRGLNGQEVVLAVQLDRVDQCGVGYSSRNHGLISRSYSTPRLHFDPEAKNACGVRRVVHCEARVEGAGR